MNQATKLSPFTAVAMLTMFKQRRITMDEETYEQCVDAIVLLLEQVNDESYRLEGRQPVTPES